jgi:predicted secreted protein
MQIKLSTTQAKYTAMKTKITKLILLLLMINGCRTPQRPKTDYTIAESESFTIRLPSNPSTGYRWQWANRKLDGIVDTTDLEFVSSRPLAEARGEVGIGGTEEWSFKGMHKGVDSIIMVHWRCWDSSTIVKKTFTVQVK